MRQPLYNKQSLAERVKELISEENEYQPLSDAALNQIIRDEGSVCSQSVIFHVRSCLGFGNTLKRRTEYAEKRKQLKGKNAK